MADLCVHCTVVFMGSKKYAGENTFDSFLSKHGGHSNASTDYEKVYIQYIEMTETITDLQQTIFYFTIRPEFFQKALDM